MPWPTFSLHSGFQPNSLTPSVPEQSSGPSKDGHSSAKFQCEYCPKAYSKQYELTKHRNNHTKPYQCYLCLNEDVRVAQSKDLHRHYWVRHKSYAELNHIPREWSDCDDCGLEFRKDNLKRHQERRKHGEYRGTT